MAVNKDFTGGKEKNLNSGHSDAYSGHTLSEGTKFFSSIILTRSYTGASILIAPLFSQMTLRGGC